MGGEEKKRGEEGKGGAERGRRSGCSDPLSPHWLRKLFSFFSFLLILGIRPRNFCSKMAVDLHDFDTVWSGLVGFHRFI